MSPIECLCKLPVEGCSDLSVIKTVWGQENFDVTIINGQNAYKGEMAKEKIHQLRSQLGITTEDYIIQCKNALTSNGGLTSFIYVLDGNVFQWKKINSDMKITFGSIFLTNVDIYETLHEIIDVSINNNCLLKQRVSEVEEESNILKKDNEELLLKISDCINLKNDAECELYSQFLSILNAKKKKIAQLEKQLKSNGLEVTMKEEGEEEDEEDEIDSEEEKKRLYEQDTEVESDESDKDIKEEMPEKTKKSSSKDNFDFESDPDLDTSYNLPKRNKLNKKSLNDIKDVKINGSETEFSGVSSNLFKPNNNKKRLSNERETTNFDDKPGPSGMKIAKILDKNKGSSTKNVIEMESINKSDTSISNLDKIKNKRSSLNDSPGKNEKSQLYNNESFQTSKESNIDPDRIVKTINDEPESRNISTIDDLISNLIS